MTVKIAPARLRITRQSRRRARGRGGGGVVSRSAPSSPPSVGKATVYNDVFS